MTGGSRNPSEDQKSIFMTAGLTNFSTVFQDCQTKIHFLKEIGGSLDVKGRGKVFAFNLLNIISACLPKLCLDD